MIRSMTGYGHGERRVGDLLVVAEARSVNHRFLDVKLKLPAAVVPVESELRRRVARRVARGRVDIGVNLQRANGSPRVQVNRPLVRSYLQAVRKLQAETGLEGVVDLALLLQVPGALRVEAEAPSITRREEAAVRAAVDAAVAALSQARNQEGMRLARDLKRRVAALGRGVRAIRKRAAELAPRRAERLRRRIAQLVDTAPVEPARLAQEVAFLADRSDIEEELVRLESHLEAMGRLLGSTRKTAGKELDFLTQELQREINTIGSKAGDLAVTQAILAMKAEVEKIREQVQNVE